MGSLEVLGGGGGEGRGHGNKSVAPQLSVLHLPPQLSAETTTLKSLKFEESQLPRVVAISGFKRILCQTMFRES